MSLSHHLSLVPLAAWPLGVGLLVNSSVFFGMLQVGALGPVTLAREKLGKTGLDTKAKVRLWALFYKRAATIIVSSISSSAVLHLAGAYLTSIPSARRASITAAIGAVSIVPFTMLVILPTNTRLLALDKQPSLTSTEDAEARELIEKWETLHRVRFAGYAVAWAGGLWALAEVVVHAAVARTIARK